MSRRPVGRAGGSSAAILSGHDIEDDHPMPTSADVRSGATVPVKILLVAREPEFRERLRLALERLEASGDRVRSGPGGDRVRSGPGGDRVRSGPGGDRVRSGPGRDRVRSRPGRDPVTFIETGDGLDAFARAEAEHPDLVVVAVGVTPYGAFGLTRDIKATPGLSCPVVIILERLQDEWLGRWSGADALVHKPVDPFALAQVARKLLEERKPAAAGA
jgi:CheY-like chemotaxis protein